MFQDLCYNDFSGTNVYDLVVPGRFFPELFRCQRLGASVTLQKPPNYGEKYLAIGIGAAFEHLPSGLSGLFGRRSHDRTRHMLHCSIRYNSIVGFSGSAAIDRKHISFPFPEKFCRDKSGHLWLIYLRREYFREIEDFVHYKTGNDGFSLQIEFKTVGTGLMVTKCGAHFVFKQDIKYLIQTEEMDSVPHH